MELRDLIDNKKKLKYLIFLIVAAAFLFRFIAGMALYSGNLTLLGGEHKRGFWDWGYFEYAELAINLAEGEGFHRIDEIEGDRWSARPPLYPLMLAGLYILFGKSSIPPILIQSVIGALTVFITYLIARHLFDERVGIIASVLAAIYPYYVFHDISLQETALFTFLTAVTIFFLLKTCNSMRLSHSFFAGIFLSLATLTRGALLTLLPFVILWFLIVLKNNKVKMILAFMSGFIIISSPWLIRNAIIHGKPLFSIQSGTVLWVGNNPYTLTGYPYEHIDRMTAKAWRALSDKEREEYTMLNEIERDNWLKKRAVQFMRENPMTVVKGAFLKIYAVMDWNITPSKGGWIKKITYTITYLPILLLGIIGAFIVGDKWKELSIVYSMFFTFIVTSAVFFGHTNHRIYLDIYLMILSSYAIIKIRDSYFPNRFEKNE